MMCEACENDDHLNCGMQTWCECDCGGGLDAGMPDFDPMADVPTDLYDEE